MRPTRREKFPGGWRKGYLNLPTGAAGTLPEGSGPGEQLGLGRAARASTASAASAALGALSEDSGIMGKALIFVALAESIALYGLLISFSILG